MALIAASRAEGGLVFTLIGGGPQGSLLGAEYLVQSSNNRVYQKMTGLSIDCLYFVKTHAVLQTI